MLSFAHHSWLISDSKCPFDFVCKCFVSLWF